MRVTTTMMNDEAVALNAKSLERLARMQSQIASGQRVQQPHDDPAAAGTALTLKSSLAANETYLQNVATAKEWLNAAEASLNGVVGILGRALNDARQGASDTLGAEERATLGQHVDGLIADALTQLNARHRGSYLFAGFKTTTQPFAPSGSPVTSVTYNGDSGTRLIEIEPGQTLAANVTGGAPTAAAFNALITLRDNLNANNTAAVSTSIASVQSALDGMLGPLADAGARGQRLGDTRTRLEKVQGGLRELLSRTEDTDMAAAITQLKQQEMVYQASLQTSARISRSNLFDFLR
ncbi:MAG: flagellar hook-associated protein FlgL [Chloroflexota bacterium]